MRAQIGKSDVHGFVRVPGSKSYTIRAAMCAAMADGVSLIEGCLESDDTAAVLECLREIGAESTPSDRGLRIRGGRLRAARRALWCRESGATLRFLTALAATIPGRTTLRCAPSLARRPMGPLLEAIGQLGVASEFDVPAGMLTVRGGRQLAGTVALRADVSSQFLSALLLSGPRYVEGMHIQLSSPAVSERYVQMTLDCMRRFGASVDVSDDGRTYEVHGGGYKPARYVVEGDWSGAAAVLALGALAGSVTIAELYRTSLQADVAMLSLLEDMGARVVCQDGKVTVSRATLKACTVDLADAIDLLPVACALGAAADGVTTLTGIARARDKESDRVSAMADGLTRLGVRVDVFDDEMRVWGGSARGGTVSSAGDHRIAMSFGVLGAVVGGVVVEGAECVSKTYPGLWGMLGGLGVEVTLDE